MHVHVSSNNDTPTRVAWAVIFLGVATSFIGEQSILASYFSIGKAMRYLIVSIIFTLVVCYAKTIYPRISKSEKIVILLVTVISIIAVANSFVLGISPDLLYFSKLIILNITIYLLAKLIPRRDLLEKYLKIIYYIACIASIQGAINVAADVSEYYYIGETVIKGLGETEDLVLPFWGITGAHVFMRSFWYFSEASYFAQFLMIGLGYAIATRRYFGTALLTIGILSSFAVASMFAILIVLVVISIASLKKLILPVATVFATLLSAYILFGELYIERAREGITQSVTNTKTISHLKQEAADIEILKEQTSILYKQLIFPYIHQSQRKAIEVKLRAVIEKIKIKERDLKVNLAGNDLVSLLILQSKNIPSSQLVVGSDAFTREASINAKVDSLKVAWQFFLKHPIGGGMANPNSIAPNLNTSAGWVGLTLCFGCLWLLVLLPIYGFIVKRIVFSPYDPLITTILITFGGLILSTFWHGPHLKYDMLFMLSLLVSATRLGTNSKSGG